MTSYAVRRLVAIATAALMVFSLFLLLADPVSATHVDPEFIPGASNSDKTCAANEGSGQSWTEFKLEGSDLSDGEYSDGTLVVKIRNITANSFDWSSNIGVDAVIVKTGADGTNLYRYDPPTEETADDGLVTPGANAISHISFCYDLEQSTTTTTAPETTTTAGETTTTAGETTTTAGETTTTAGETTTTAAETTTTAGETTTTFPDEVLPTEVTSTSVADASTLPFTGSESENLALIAMSLSAIGALILVATRGAGDSGRHLRR